LVVDRFLIVPQVAAPAAPVRPLQRVERELEYAEDKPAWLAELEREATPPLDVEHSLSSASGLAPPPLDGLARRGRSREGRRGEEGASAEAGGGVARSRRGGALEQSLSSASHFIFLNETDAGGAPGSARRSWVPPS
jgi:hypothetical protein